MVHIPFELVNQILDNVDQKADFYQCALVNKPFNAAANPKLWQHPDIFDHDGQRITSISSTLLNCLRQSQKNSSHKVPLGHLVRKLEFGKGNWIPDILKLLPLTPHIQHVEFKGQVLTLKTIKAFAQHCPQLERLCLSNIAQIPSHLLAPIGQYCTQLRDLEINICPRLSPTILMDLKQCPLERLSLSGISIANNEAMVTSIHHLSLVDLTLTHCSFAPALILSARTLPRLTRLEISGPWMIPPDELARFIRLQPALTTFNLSQGMINTTVLDAIADSKIDHLYLLKSLDLAPFTRSYPLVKHLVLYHKIDDAVLATLAASFPHLITLALDTEDFPSLDCDDTTERWIPTSPAVTRLVKNCTQLARVDFNQVFKACTLGWHILPLKRLELMDLDYIRRL